MADIGQADLEDSNMANYGSKEHKDLRKAAAASDKMFKGAGEKPGLKVWRVENKRTESDTPDFGVNHWPKEEYGKFYSGDSYLVLNTYQIIDPETKKKTDKLGFDVHFWLGNESSQDEIGVAAYKAVELDDLLDDAPVQHREVQGHESRLFQTYFKEIMYMEGGIESGFRKVKPEEYVPQLHQVRRTGRSVRAYPVPCKSSSMNHGDVFVLDAGLSVYVWIGETANAFEKSKGAALAHNIVNSRLGKAKNVTIDDKFWEILGSEDDIRSEDDPFLPPENDVKMDPKNLKLFRVSDASGSLEFTKEAEGELNTDMLDSDDVFIIDAKAEIFIWVGNGATKQEKKQAMPLALKYIENEGLPKHTSCTRILEGQLNASFGQLLKF